MLYVVLLVLSGATKTTSFKILLHGHPTIPRSVKSADEDVSLDNPDRSKGYIFRQFIGSTLNRLHLYFTY
jgi:hypothetical protein